VGMIQGRLVPVFDDVVFENDEMRKLRVGGKLKRGLKDSTLTAVFLIVVDPELLDSGWSVLGCSDSETEGWMSL
jgi:hypothetical protein